MNIQKIGIESNTSELITEAGRYTFYMCKKGKCKFYKDNKCQKGRNVLICAKGGFKNKE